jgi:hypothetical protein
MINHYNLGYIKFTKIKFSRKKKSELLIFKNIDGVKICFTSATKSMVAIIFRQSIHTYKSTNLKFAKHVEFDPYKGIKYWY